MASPAAKENHTNKFDNWYSKNRSLSLRQTPFWAQGIAGVAASISVIAVISGFAFRIDEVVVARGQLKAVGGTVDVSSAVDGKVESIHFEDNEYVKKGQLLVQLESSNSIIERELLKKQLSDENVSLQNNLKAISGQRETLKRRLKVYSRKIETKAEILNSLNFLVSQGGYQKIQYLNAQDELLEMENNLENISQQLLEIDLRENETLVQHNKTKAKILARLDIIEYNIKNQKVFSPSNGIILSPKATKGLPIYKGNVILSIVPNNDVYAEVLISNKDIGLIESGQNAKVRVDAYPFATFGEIPGKITQIAADSRIDGENKNNYPIKISLEKSENTKFNDLKLVPGMSVQANLKLRDKPVISIISDLFTRQVDSVKSIRSER